MKVFILIFCLLIGVTGFCQNEIDYQNKRLINSLNKNGISAFSELEEISSDSKLQNEFNGKFFKVIGGELQERLIPVPYSKNTTDQAVSAAPQQHFPFCVFLSLFYFIFYFYYYSYYSCSFFYFSSSSLPQIKHFVMEVTKEMCERLVERHAES